MKCHDGSDRIVDPNELVFLSRVSNSSVTRTSNLEKEKEEETKEKFRLL